MRTYQLLEPANGFAKIITYPQGEKKHISVILITNKEIQIFSKNIFKFLLNQVLLETIDPFLAADILKDYAYLFEQYSADKLDLSPLLKVNLAPKSTNELQIFELKNTYDMMLKSIKDANLALNFADLLVKQERQSAAIFIYKVLLLCKNPNRHHEALKQILDNLSSAFSTPYESSRYLSTSTPKYQPSPLGFFPQTIEKNQYNPDLEQIIALSLQDNDKSHFSKLTSPPANFFPPTTEQNQHDFEQAIALSLQANKAIKRHSLPWLFGVSRKELIIFTSKNMIKNIHLPEHYLPGSAVDDGGCFFDSLAQILNQMHDTNIYSEVYLRNVCFNYYVKHSDFVNQLHEKDYSNNSKSYPYKMIQHSSSSIREAAPIWGRTHVEGRILCLALSENILPAIHVIEFLLDPESNQPIPVFFQCTKDGQEPIDLGNFYLDNVPILALTQEDRHYIPIMPIREDDELSQALRFSLV